jgi:hypothetical protein
MVAVAAKAEGFKTALYGVTAIWALCLLLAVLLHLAVWLVKS